MKGHPAEFRILGAAGHRPKPVGWVKWSERGMEPTDLDAVVCPRPVGRHPVRLLSGWWVPLRCTHPRPSWLPS
jgi:hypothetical protein